MENNYKYIVYQTININNNKIYIGVHRVVDVYKFDGYIGCGVNIKYPTTYMNPQTPFQFAVKKHGVDSFKRSILYVFENEDDAYKKEEELVNSEFINRKDTYNACLGGRQPIHAKYREIYQFDSTGKILKRWNSVYDICDSLMVRKECIYSAINNKQQLYNSYWSYNSEIETSKYSNPNKCKKVYKYNKDKKCVAIYNSIGDTAKVENLLASHIYGLIKNESLSKNGFYFSFKLYDEFTFRPQLQLRDKNLYLYSKNGSFIKCMDIKSFKKEYNIHTYKEISDAILDKRIIKGFQISLTKEEKIEAYSPVNKQKSVTVMSLDGLTEEKFESITSAVKKFGFDWSTVCKILRGCAKSTKGYTIKYND